MFLLAVRFFLKFTGIGPAFHIATDRPGKLPDNPQAVVG